MAKYLGPLPGQSLRLYYSSLGIPWHLHHLAFEYYTLAMHTEMHFACHTLAIEYGATF